MTLVFISTVWTLFKNTLIARLGPSLLETQRNASPINAKAIRERRKDSK